MLIFFLTIIIPDNFFPISLIHFFNSTNQQTSEMYTDITLDLNTTLLNLTNAFPVVCY